MNTQFDIEKLIFGGQALAHAEDGKAVMLWNALPGEKVGVEGVNKRKGVYEAWATDIIQANPHRIAPVDEHFGSCSPWQIMDYAYENEQKVAIAKEAYEHIGKLHYPMLHIEAPVERFGYRNKLEWSFVEDEAGTPQLGFFARGSRRKRPVDACHLALPVVNEVSHYLLEWAHQQQIPMRSLKSLIVRGTRNGHAIAALCIKDRLELPLPKLTEKLQGFQLVYSTHKSPASVFTDILGSEGEQVLSEKIADVTFSYGIESFFQVYVEVFETVLQAIKTHIPKETPVLDYYAGVGSIGLAVASSVPHVTLVESNQEAVSFAQRNIRVNEIENAEAYCAPAEQLTELIDSAHTLIVDPPRAGLHQKVIDRILEQLPKRVIYLSCNVSTQARDLALLGLSYEVKDLSLFNFFPATPHIEGLALLQRRVQ
jgi:23S rRNA (uracil1939-C5)-methyltransferase